MRNCGKNSKSKDRKGQRAKKEEKPAVKMTIKDSLKKQKKSKQTVKKQDIEGINAFEWGVKRFAFL